jgi:pyrimidine operon attenuation protein/uracil phosphoribosyltransferase
LDITFHRDDYRERLVIPQVKGTDISFSLDGKTVILVDDVLYTGRTIRAAMDELNSFGRAAKVQLAVLVDRGHRELPIKADYVGKNIPTHEGEHVNVTLTETDEVDSVYLIRSAG